MDSVRPVVLHSHPERDLMCDAGLESSCTTRFLDGRQRGGDEGLLCSQFGTRGTFISRLVSEPPLYKQKYCLARAWGMRNHGRGVSSIPGDPLSQLY